MIKKIKIRDLTEEQRDEIHKHFLSDGRCCEKCPFMTESIDGHRCCLKQIAVPFLSNDFLNKEVEIEVPDILTQEEKEWLKNFQNGCALRIKTVEFFFSETGLVSDGKVPFIELSSIAFCCTIRVRRDWFKGMEQGKAYTLEDLGL